MAPFPATSSNWSENLAGLRQSRYAMCRMASPFIRPSVNCTILAVPGDGKVAKMASQAHRSSPSEQAVLRATGRERKQWFALLDAWEATTRAHRDIAAWLMSDHNIENWWAQTLTVDYERARGLREPGAKRDGTFSVTVSITLGVSAKRAFAAFVDTKLRQRWLPRATLQERTSTSGRSARFDWKDGSTRVNVGFTAKGTTRSQVALQHERLSSAQAAKEMRAFWRNHLDTLKALLEG